MTKAAVSLEIPKGKGHAIFEYILFALCLCIIGLRAVLTEAPNIRSSPQLISPAYNVLSLSISGVLIFAFTIWFIRQFCGKRFSYRYTAVEIGMCLFCVAAIIAGFAASNKRAAITNFATLLAPLLMAVLLTQILDSYSKIKLLLYTIACLGAVAGLYCACQFFWVNRIIINQYQTDPNTLLEKIGVTPGSFQHMLFEQSLNSKDVRGFFTTGNSAGSFALLASFAGIGLFIENLKSPKSVFRRHRAILISGIFAFASIFGLAITHSKGAITASLVAAVMFVVYLLFSDWLKRHKKVILIVCLLLLLAGACAVILYGLSHGRLPGGNSMLVRWQYWYASVRMYSDHPFTGVGPGNFAQFYPHYKTAAAIETVADPHNFLLNILSQYGPIGLAGFVAVVFIPLAKIIFSTPVKTTPDKHTGQSHFFITAAIFCAILGFLLHNCIDFAIFEPGILTTFWAIMACLIALDFHQKGRTPLTLKPVAFVRIVAILAGLVLIGAYFNYALIPVTKAGAKTKIAMQEAISAHQLLDEAAEDDRLDPTALNLNGRFYLQQYNETAKKQPALLKQGEQCFLAAIGRDEADYKNYEKLSEVYNSLAETSSGQEKTDWLNKAFDSASSAVERYPGSGRLRIELAKIAEQLGKTDIAIEHYKEAIRIEDAYRGQFQIMYPGREIFSRLGEEKYQFSKQRIKQLRP